MRAEVDVTEYIWTSAPDGDASSLHPSGGEERERLLSGPPVSAVEENLRLCEQTKRKNVK